MAYFEGSILIWCRFFQTISLLSWLSVFKSFYYRTNVREFVCFLNFFLKFKTYFHKFKKGIPIRKWRDGFRRGFAIFWVRILEFSAYALFMISWSLSKFELIYTTFFSQFPRGDQKKKTQKPKKAEKVQPNVLIGLFVHFPY